MTPELLASLRDQLKEIKQQETDRTIGSGHLINVDIDRLLDRDLEMYQLVITCSLNSEQGHQTLEAYRQEIHECKDHNRGLFSAFIGNKFNVIWCNEEVKQGKG